VFYGCSGTDTGGNDGIAENISWNEIDSEMIADSIVNKLLLSEWNINFTTKRKPKIIVGSIRDLTNEKINTDLLSKNIERSLINSGDVTFISSKSEREMIRNNRRNKNDFNDDIELKKYFQPLKSDFFISGSINLSIDSISVPMRNEYKLTLELINTNNIESVYITSQTLNK